MNPNIDATCWACGEDFDFDAAAKKESKSDGTHRIRTRCPECFVVNYNVYARQRWDEKNEPMPLARRAAAT